MLSIRLRRQGTNKRPFYRIVVSDSRLTPRARVVDTVGHFDPLRKPRVAEVDLPRVEHWIGKGARPSDTVLDLVKAARVKAAATA